MFKIAVTGGLACGKSTVGKYLAGSGLAVCDADDLAHSLMVPGKPVFDEIVKLFGMEILGADGEIDRRSFGSRVFSNPDELKELNKIVHPAVKKAWIDWLECRARDNYRAAAVLVPLLYEAGEGNGWDAVICVSASRNTQVQRLEARGLSPDDIQRRIEAQMPLAEKAELADFVIINDESMDLLRQQTMIVINNIMEK